MKELDFTQLSSETERTTEKTVAVAGEEKMKKTADVDDEEETEWIESADGDEEMEKPLRTEKTKSEDDEEETEWTDAVDDKEEVGKHDATKGEEETTQVLEAEENYVCSQWMPETNVNEIDNLWNVMEVRLKEVEARLHSLVTATFHEHRRVMRGVFEEVIRKNEAEDLVHRTERR